MSAPVLGLGVPWPRRNLPCQRLTPEEATWDQVSQLYACHGDVPVEMRLLKLAEEVGEVAEAFTGMQGLFSDLRK
ncbi:MAG: hypothetical protein ACRDND_10505 [Streptosporangiaceae bacterium]